MAAATSPATGQAYGVKRVCTIWDVARSSFYAARRQDARPAGRPAGRRGPKPALSDADLLAAIRRDLERSPWSGEGHRKVWARLRVIDGIRVSRSRVLRLMRENSLLSPHQPAHRLQLSLRREALRRWPAGGLASASCSGALRQVRRLRRRCINHFVHSALLPSRFV
jgi:hypothetical protein